MGRSYTEPGDIPLALRGWRWDVKAGAPGAQGPSGKKRAGGVCHG